MVFKRKRWNPQTRAQMLQLFRDGVAVEKLAEKYGVTPTAIRQQASEYGVYRTPDHISAVNRRSSGLPNVVRGRDE